MENKDKVVLSIVEKEDGLEVMVNEGAYGNVAVIGLLEKIKYNLVSVEPESKPQDYIPNVAQKYDA